MGCSDIPKIFFVSSDFFRNAHFIQKIYYHIQSVIFFIIMLLSPIKDSLAAANLTYRHFIYICWMPWLESAPNF